MNRFLNRDVFSNGLSRVVSDGRERVVGELDGASTETSRNTMPSVTPPNVFTYLEENEEKTRGGK